MITGASEHQLDIAELTEAAEAVRPEEFARKMAQLAAQDQESFAKLRDSRLRRRMPGMRSLIAVERLPTTGSF